MLRDDTGVSALIRIFLGICCEEKSRSDGCLTSVANCKARECSDKEYMHAMDRLGQSQGFFTLSREVEPGIHCKFRPPISSKNYLFL